MKRLFLLFAVLAGFTGSAAATNLTSDIVNYYQEKQYKKIDVSAIPKETLDKIKKSYGTYTIKEAAKADDGEYKLVLTKDGIDLTATFTPSGDLIKILN
ncbi:hypothetical protein [Flavobacterium psychrotrophum]|uniref:hypothetical protein n=1 Tax=Flavobacterium psychrotrophum TaxID=2294119 RepID=UPI000E30D91E|nr:hypothetical protein [Flavobacterium psychrotrophum]